MKDGIHLENINKAQQHTFKKRKTAPSPSNLCLHVYVGSSHQDHDFTWRRSFSLPSFSWLRASWLLLPSLLRASSRASSSLWPSLLWPSLLWPSSLWPSSQGPSWSASLLLLPSPFSLVLPC